MRITKVEVDRKKVLISRDKNGGKLVYENEMQDNTEQIMHHKTSRGGPVPAFVPFSEG